MPTPKPILIIQGAQYGSEAKGMVAAALCQKLNIDYAVRTGAINAGHTVIHQGKAWKMQQLPTGWVNPNTKLVIGAGALVHPRTLENEISEIEKVGPLPKIFVDHQAGIHYQLHADRSHSSGRHHAIGATGKGCSEALTDRIRNRGANEVDGAPKLFRDHCAKSGYLGEAPFIWEDTSQLLNREYDFGSSILLEGTQGSHLDLYFGPYPYVTHKPCNAGTWAVEAGLSPALDYEVVLVVRSYPIRVAGNSGPMPHEISWTDLAARINTRLTMTGHAPLVKGSSLLAWEEARMLVANANKVDVPRDRGGRPMVDFHNFVDQELRSKYQVAISELDRMAFEVIEPDVKEDLCNLFEFTTVTKKLRRIAELDWGMLRTAVMWNRPAYCVLTFANYLWPEIWGTTDWDEWPSETKQGMKKFLDEFHHQTGVHVRYVSTGPESKHLLEV